MAKIFIPKKTELIPENIRNKMDFDGVSYSIENTPENKIEFQNYLPYGFRDSFTKLQIDLIPKTSWGASLASSLVPEDWSRIRKPFIEHHGNRCQLCGQVGKSASKTIQDVDTHEIWEYSDLPNGNKVQTLKGFMALCSGCHLMFHLGFAKVDNKYDTTIKRLQRLEKLNKEQLNKRLENIFNTWEERSNHEWMIDLKILKEYGIDDLRFKKSKNIDISKFIL